MAWNRPTEKVKTTAKSSTKSRWVIVTVVILVGCSFGIWYLTRSTPEVSQVAERTEHADAEAKGSGAKASGFVAAGKTIATSRIDRACVSVASAKATPADSPENRVPEVVKTNAENRAQLEKFSREPVKGRAEQLLMLVFPQKKGDLVPPVPIDIEADSELENEAQAILERQGVVEEWDDEHSVQIKERLEALKDEWYAFKQKGGSFHDFILQHQNVANFDTDTLDEARKFDQDNYDDRTMSDADYLEAHKKVNKLLEIQGFEKLKLPNAEVEEEEATATAPGDQK